jgi:DNA-binding response OmpR family regulator
MPSILLIEDDDLFREALADALTEHGYAVTQAADGEIGANRTLKKPFTLPTLLQAIGEVLGLLPAAVPS